MTCKTTEYYGFSTQFKLRCYLIGHQEIYKALKNKEGTVLIRLSEIN